MAALVLGDDTEDKTSGERGSTATVAGGVFELDWRGVKGLADVVSGITTGEPQNSIAFNFCRFFQSYVDGSIETRVEELGVVRR